MKITFHLNQIEYLCYRRMHELAGMQLLALLGDIERHSGIMNIDEWAQSEQAADIMDEHLFTRLTAAITALAIDPGFTISEADMARLAPFQPWLSVLFAVSPFRNADHILRSFGEREPAKNDVQPRSSELCKFGLFYLSESEVRFDWDVFWQANKLAAATLAVTLLSNRMMVSPAAHQKREMLLRWLPERLEQIESIDALPMSVLPGLYMHCSYADDPAKHAIKKPINTLIGRKLAALGLVDDRRPARLPAPGQKPVLVVVLEWFSREHSIYRTHSQTMVAMRERFHLIGMGHEKHVDDAGKAVFHEFIPIVGGDIWEQIRCVQQVCSAHEAQIVYMPSVGMFPITMVLACLRVAPLQMMALGHPATTHAPAMDYVVVEEDYVGDPACFSEKLLQLPKDGMPYRPRAAMQTLVLPPRRAPAPQQQAVVKVAVAAAIMKLNPGFLQACGEIVRRARVPVQFHFLVGMANGLPLLQVRDVVRSLVGQEAVTHGEQDYEKYMQTIAECDLFLNPFPFGNTNGIVDTVWAGLMGVCRTGREVHEHIDEGMFRRLGFPEWTIARSTPEYVQAALRLINDAEERARLERQMCGPQAVEKLIFQGRPEILGERMEHLWHEAVRAAGA